MQFRGTFNFFGGNNRLQSFNDYFVAPLAYSLHQLFSLNLYFSLAFKCIFLPCSWKITLVSYQEE